MLRTDHVVGGLFVAFGFLILALSGDLPLGTLSFPGYGLRKFGLDPAPLVLGLVISPILEMSLRQSLIMSNGNWTIFFQRPIALALLAAATAMLALAVLSVQRQRKDWRRQLAEAEAGDSA